MKGHLIVVVPIFALTNNSEKLSGKSCDEVSSKNAKGLYDKSLLYINDLAALDDKYVLVTPAVGVILARADGTKTVGDLLSEALTTLRNYTVDADELYRIDIVRVPDGNGTNHRTSFSMGGSTNKLYDTFIDINFDLFYMHASETHIVTNAIYVTSSTARAFVGGTDITVFVPSSGTVLNVTMEKYVKI